MPLNNPSPNFALLSSFDARSWDNTQVFNRNGTGVTLPNFTTGEGIYEDAISFLNGRGSKSAQSATTSIQTVSSFGTSWSVALSSADRIEITADVDFTITSTGAVDALGLSGGTTSPSGANYALTAPHDWTRGGFNLRAASNTVYRFDEVGGAGSFTWPAGSLGIQDVIIFLRRRGLESDVDDVDASTNLEALDIAAQGSDLIRWLINDEGHVECHHLSYVGDITWNSTTFRDRLGFSGDETPITRGGNEILVADHPLPGALFPSRPYQSHYLKTSTVSQSRRKIAGGYTSNFIGSYITSVLLFDLDALLDVRDLYRHFTNHFVQYIPSGERINFYQGWGDSRRALITASIDATQAAYTLLYTSEDNGDQGRVRASNITNDVSLSYPNRLRRRVPVRLELEHL